MNKEKNSQVIFNQLKNAMDKASGDLTCDQIKPDQFHLNTKHLMKNKKPLYFGGVVINKNYVSYHLMPVYVFPDLLNDISSELSRRMQGKSCFNFKSIDHELFKELAVLTETGYKKYQEAGYV